MKRINNATNINRLILFYISDNRKTEICKILKYKSKDKKIVKLGFNLIFYYK